MSNSYTISEFAPGRHVVLITSGDRTIHSFECKGDRAAVIATARRAASALRPVRSTSPGGFKAYWHSGGK